ncbi:MAG: hypothetical protein GX330_04285 [Bacteroidales bacterium]|nr:hypothetical protein [Bacteroidales bacterium]
MDTLIKKITNIALIAIGLLAAASSITYLLVKANVAMNLSFYILYAMLAAVIIVLLSFTIFRIFTDKAQIIKTAILLVAFAAVIIIGYIIAPSELSEIATRLEVSTFVFKWVGTAINVVYIIFLGVIAAFIGSLIYIKLKK